MSMVRHYTTSKDPLMSLLTHDTFSQMPMQEPTPLAMVGKDNKPYSNRTDRHPTGKPATMPGLNAESLECHFSWTDVREILGCFQHLPAEECYLNIPEASAIDNPLDMEAIKEQQEADQELQQQATKYMDGCVCKLGHRCTGPFPRRPTKAQGRAPSAPRRCS